MQEVIHRYRQWKLARLRYKSSLRREGSKGPLVRRALRELISAKSAVSKAIESERELQRITRNGVVA